jgi:hypothetical protein
MPTHRPIEGKMERKEAIENAVWDALDTPSGFSTSFDPEAFERALEEAGFVIVPREPSDEMIREGAFQGMRQHQTNYDCIAAAYHAMIGARGR